MQYSVHEIPASPTSFYSLLDYNWASILDLIGVASITITSLVLFYVLFRVILLGRSLNRKTLMKIRRLAEIGKYLDDVFVELNNAKELLRYFLHGTKWKKRIITNYNELFNTYVGQLAKENICDKICFSIPRFSNLTSIKTSIVEAKEYIVNSRKRENINLGKEEAGNLKHYIVSALHGYDEFLYALEKKVEMISSRHILIIGNAGNGKTNLLCSFSETVIKYDHPCVFIDAKEIKGDCEQFLINVFGIPQVGRFKMSPTVFLSVYSILLRICKKRLFVVIDAINENDTTDFREVLRQLLDKLSEYRRVNILISCRNEYFDERFKIVFDEIRIPFADLRVNDIDYDERAMEKALVNYQTYFNVSGVILGSAKEKLFRSLLLMRIFFEVNKGKEVNALELRNAEIYKEYIKRVNEKVKAEGSLIDFEVVLEKITAHMLTTDSYEGVIINCLPLDYHESKELSVVFDGNLIIGKKIKIGQGIVEKEAEMLYFVFDELRDFCLARAVLRCCEDNDIPNYSQLFDFLRKLDADKLSPLEGVLKYAYYYIKNDSPNPNRFSLCEKLLTDYSVTVKCDPWINRNAVFSDFGIIMIIADSSSLEEFESKYLVNAMKTIRDFWRMLNLLFDNEIAKTGLNTGVFVSILLSYSTDSINTTIEKMLKENDYNDSDSKELVAFCMKVLRQSEISIEMKFILLIMSRVRSWSEPLEKCIEKFNVDNLKKADIIFRLPVSDNDSIDDMLDLVFGRYGGAQW